MPRTKHLVLGVLLGAVVCGVWGASQLTSMTSSRASVAPSLLLANPTAASLTATVASDTVRESARERIKQRLQVQTEPSTPLLSDAESSDTAPNASADVPIRSLSTDHEARVGGVPLGDTRARTSPHVGSILNCGPIDQKRTPEVPWIRDRYWYPNERPTVHGAIFGEQSITAHAVEGARVINTRAIPPHAMGVFPIPTHESAHAYARGESAPQRPMLTFQLPQEPRLAARPSCIAGPYVGVARNGVPIYAGNWNRGYDAGAVRLTDRCGGSTDAFGTYHYTRENACLVDAYYEGASATLLGYALDGFGIFASVENGTKRTNKDLDSCHGHTHEIPWDGKIVSMYHYHMTDEYPYSVGCFMGTPSLPVIEWEKE